MDPLDFLEQGDLLKFFRRNKTAMSLMENPQTFLRQVRDHDLIPEDDYQRVSRMRSKANLQTGLYEVLDWLERNQSQHILAFWICVFKDHIMNQYPLLKELRNSLLDGTYCSQVQLPERLEREETDNGRSEDMSEEEEEENQKKSVKKTKRNLRTETVCSEEEEEEPGPSSKATSSQRRKSKRICYSPQKKGEKNDIWTWPLYRLHLPVTCGDKDGTLHRDKLAKGEKCIKVGKKWVLPSEFERCAGKGNSKNWKLSIRCNGTSLGTLIKEGHLKTSGFNRFRKASQVSSDQSATGCLGNEDESENEDCDLDGEEQASTSRTANFSEGEEGGTVDQPESSESVFEVSCGALTGTLYKKRFATGDRGKSIRTEERWMSPVEFTMEAFGETNATWKRNITHRGEPLNVLIEAKILLIHSALCKCDLCLPDNQEDQKNDDKCFICKRGINLVLCDYCPRSFHQKCHLPHIEDSTLSDDGPWACTICVFRRNRDCFYREELEMDAAMSCKISKHMHICHYLLLTVWSEDEEQIFAKDPRLYVKDYSKVIKSPMWFRRVAERLQNSTYDILGEFASDVLLIFTNCALYNKERAEFLALGKRLNEIFDTELKSVFHILDQNEG